MKIQVYNTLTQKKEEFVPRTPGEVSIYVCGVTPYARTHLGHARPSVVWDVITKFFRAQGYKVLFVQNFTDVDDKIIEKALQEGTPALEFSRRYIAEYLASMDALGVERADVYPKVSEHIPEILALVERLIENDHAYESAGDVFFQVATFPEYGKLSKQKLSELRQGTRFDVDPGKREAVDFALWKRAKLEEPSWESPWGLGRPGWHIECSAMSLKYLGENFDFHGGGNDLVFPHHENEIAQSEAATGAPFVRYWVHNGMVNLRDAKMSKSLGNVISVSELAKRYPKELLRFYLLSTHYRSGLEFYEGKLEEISKGWSRLNDGSRNLYNDLASAVDGPRSEEDQAALERLEAFENDLLAAFADDFNTALAIGVLFEVTREVNSYRHAQGNHFAVLEKAWEIFERYGVEILGVIHWQKPQQEGLVDGLLELLLELRQQLREERNYALADQIRDKLAELGVTVEDTSQGPRWKV